MKAKTVFCCSECGYESPKWMGKCPKCGSYMLLAKDGKTKKCSSKECGYVIKPEKEKNDESK